MYLDQVAARLRPSRVLRSLRARVLVYLRPLMLHTPRSLVTRLLALLLAGMILIYLVGVVSLWWISSILVETGLRKQAVQWIAEMRQLGPALYGRADGSDLLFIEGRIKNFPEIAFVRFYDASGRRVLRSFGPQQEAAPPLVERQLQALAKGGHAYLVDESIPVGNPLFGMHYVRVIAPLRVRSIRADGLLDFKLDGSVDKIRSLGYIDLAIDPSLHRGSIAKIVGLGSLITAVLFVIALMVGRRLLKQALTPLLELQTPLARLARGDTDVRVTARGDTEIVAIGNALNATIKALNQRDAILRKLAEHDALTGLYNRGHFSHLLDAEIQRLKREGGTSALIFIDLDRFKYINDVLGHAGGDRLLMQVAGLIKAHMRSSDAVGRFGGDEFTGLTRDVPRAAAIELAKLVSDIMRDYHFVDRGQTFSVCCSIGVALITPASGNAEEVLLQADTACYEAKCRGRNRVHVYDGSSHEVSSTWKDIGWSELIRHALKENTFKLAYQPIVGIDHAEEYYEVLIRMPDEHGRDVAPGAFLAVAERFGLVPEIDQWVITHALAALARFRRDGRHIIFSINLSGQTFEDPSIVQLIKDALRKHKLPASALVFEITEQTAVRYMDKARRLMQSLIDLGCRFSLDDFGVGFSSFSYLKHFPVSFIKIDGSFVENMASDPIDQAMVRSMTQIARALGKKVIAEFVQNEETLRLLRHYKVDYMQGHYVGAPLYALVPPQLPKSARRAAHPLTR